MKRYLLPFVCLALAGCVREDAHYREVMTKLDALNSEVAALQTATANTASLRWAYANKSEINTVIFLWTQAKLDEAKKTETLSPDQQEKLAEYDSLQTQMMRTRVPMPRFVRPGELPPEATAEDKEYAELVKKVAEAKIPVAAIVDRRNSEAAKLREAYSVERTIAEYVKGRYDIVVDSNQKVLYRSSGEVPDITEGVITFFKQKQK